MDCVGNDAANVHGTEETGDSIDSPVIGGAEDHIWDTMEGHTDGAYGIRAEGLGNADGLGMAVGERGGLDAMASSDVRLRPARLAASGGVMERWLGTSPSWYSLRERGDGAGTSSTSRRR